MINVEEIATADIAPGYTRVNVTFQLAKASGPDLDISPFQAPK